MYKIFDILTIIGVLIFQLVFILFMIGLILVIWDKIEVILYFKILSSLVTLGVLFIGLGSNKR